jgi:hypothetical protein
LPFRTIAYFWFRRKDLFGFVSPANFLEFSIPAGALPFTVGPLHASQVSAVTIEYAPQRLGGDAIKHIHTIYRDPTNDYGVKWWKR